MGHAPLVISDGDCDDTSSDDFQELQTLKHFVFEGFILPKVC